MEHSLIFSRRHRVFPAVFILVFAILPAGCAKPESPAAGLAASSPSSAHPVLVFMTDFGAANDAVAICKAVMAGIAPDTRIMDITHQVTPFSIEEGARFLAGVTPYYPAGTVFVGVIDPGVGTNRKAVVVKSKKGQYFVVPDNGLVSLVLDRDGLDSAREISNSSCMIGDAISSTFHGRDIFSPVGAHLAAGWDYTLVGPELQQLVRLTPKTATATDKGIEGDIIGLDDPFGSLISDIPGDEFKKLGYVLGDRVTVQLNKKTVHRAVRENVYGCTRGRSPVVCRFAGQSQPRFERTEFFDGEQDHPAGNHFHPEKARGSEGQVKRPLERMRIGFPHRVETRRTAFRRCSGMRRSRRRIHAG